MQVALNVGKEIILNKIHWITTKYNGAYVAVHRILKLLMDLVSANNLPNETMCFATNKLRSGRVGWGIYRVGNNSIKYTHTKVIYNTITQTERGMEVGIEWENWPRHTYST